MTRKIIHCDADCFFVALEMRDDSDLCGIPVAVGGKTENRGVISTCNYEARAFGVHSAMSSAYAKQLCPQLIILPHRIEKYRDAATVMRRIFLDYTDAVEPLSLDEAYLDVTDAHHCLGSATLIAKEIRRRIQKEVGITASAGVSVNKFLAKVASDWQKPNGLTIIEPERIRFFLKRLPVNCIPGVGPSLTKKLRNGGITTCHDLQKLTEEQLMQRFGKFGQRLYHYSHGNDDRLVKVGEWRKSLSVEHTFNRDIHTLEHCSSLLSGLSEKLLERLARVNNKQTIIKCFVKIKFSGFEQTRVEAPSRRFCLALCKQLLVTAWHRYGKPVRLLGLGVRFSENIGQYGMQLSLFE